MLTNWEQRLDQTIDSRFAEMVAMRRHLHQFPEVSGEERETTFYLYQMLGDAGFDVRMGPDGRGMIADLAPKSGPPAKGLLALRADIDALRIHDEKQVPYRSQVDGVMHACGHDCHTAIAVTALLTFGSWSRTARCPGRFECGGSFSPRKRRPKGLAR